jgi:hypothetical protein
MKKLLGLIRLLVPILVILGVSGSCKKDEDCNEAIECCTWTDDFGTDYSYCRDLPVWAAYYASWEVLVQEAHSYGGKCTCD